MLDVNTEKNALDLKTCKFCQQANPSYCCPRCNCLYCSSTCYRSSEHAQCSEEFYKRCVCDVADFDRRQLLHEHGEDEELKRILAHHDSCMSQLSANKMGCEMPCDGTSLNDAKVDSESQEIQIDDEEVPSLEKRLSSVNLDDANAVWAQLTEQERDEFTQNLYASDDNHTRWWCKKFSPVLYDRSAASCTQTSHLPCQPLTAISAQLDMLRPSKSGCSRLQPDTDLMLYLLTCSLCSYVHVHRVLSVWHIECLREVAECWQSSCHWLGSRVGPALVQYLARAMSAQGRDVCVSQLAVYDVWSCVTGPQAGHSVWPEGVTDCALDTLQDSVVRILEGPSAHEPTLYIHTALTNMHKVLNAVRKFLRETATNSASRRVSCSVQSVAFSKAEEHLAWIKQAMMKLRLLMAWSQVNANLLQKIVKETSSKKIRMPF